MDVANRTPLPINLLLAAYPQHDGAVVVRDLNWLRALQEVLSGKQLDTTITVLRTEAGCLARCEQGDWKTSLGNVQLK